MKKLDALKQISTKPALAKLLGVSPKNLTHTLYIVRPENLYTSFNIPKRTGGIRTIYAPADKLKIIQSKLSDLLQECIKEINDTKYPNLKPNKAPTLAHGFVRKRSILTNASVHLKQKNVLNIDLSDFFDSFHFGRVRGFFIKNRNFELHPDIATVIAQIACLDNKLPQGSPCSPVITNLITHSLDIRLASLAKKYSCSYSRYADDITFSTRKSVFPNQIMGQEENGEYIAGKKLTREITRAGFSINDKKTRIQYKDSRQDVTGLIVNKKPNVKKEYWRTVKSQCHRLFHTGAFTKNIYEGGVEVEVEGNINELGGQLNFIDQVDKFNRKRQKPLLNHTYQLARHGFDTRPLLSGREKTLSKFLYYRSFYGNTKPTILCEGETDIVYFKSAINKLASYYPSLANERKESSNYELLIRLVKYSERTRFLLQLKGGTSYLNNFINKFGKNYEGFKAPRPQHPVIIVLDNDYGFSGKKEKGIEAQLNKISSVRIYPSTLAKGAYREAEFIHVVHNLYIVLTPLDSSKNQTNIEDLFEAATRKTKVSNKSFNPEKDFDKSKEYGKVIFANKVIKEQKNSIVFDGFKPLLERMVKAIKHYDSIKHL